MDDIEIGEGSERGLLLGHRRARGATTRTGISTKEGGGGRGGQTAVIPSSFEASFASSLSTSFHSSSLAALARCAFVVLLVLVVPLLIASSSSSSSSSSIITRNNRTTTTSRWWRPALVTLVDAHPFSSSSMSLFRSLSSSPRALMRHVDDWSRVGGGGDVGDPSSGMRGRWGSGRPKGSRNKRSSNSSSSSSGRGSKSKTTRKRSTAAAAVAAADEEGATATTTTTSTSSTSNLPAVQSGQRWRGKKFESPPKEDATISSTQREIRSLHSRLMAIRRRRLLNEEAREQRLNRDHAKAAAGLGKDASFSLDEDEVKFVGPPGYHTEYQLWQRRKALSLQQEEALEQRLEQLLEEEEKNTGTSGAENDFFRHAMQWKRHEQQRKKK